MALFATTYFLFISQEYGSKNSTLQRIIECGHQVVHPVVVPKSSQISKHQLYLSVADEHQHKSTNCKEPKQKADKLTVKSFKVGRSFVLFDGAIALSKVKAIWDQSANIQINQKICIKPNQKGHFDCLAYPNTLK